MDLSVMLEGLRLGGDWPLAMLVTESPFDWLTVIPLKSGILRSWRRSPRSFVQPLADGYRAEVDCIEPNAWFQHVASFNDANLYQFWQHGSNGERFTAASQLMLKRRKDLVAAAEVRLFRFPMTELGIAHVRWGPVRRHCPEIPDTEVFRQMIRALNNEYVRRRRMVLRIIPRLFVERDQEYLQILADEGFSRLQDVPQKKSLVLDLSPDLQDLRKGLKKKWRNCLGKSERSDLTVTAGTSLELFDEFIALYNRMLEKKTFTPTADVAKHRRIQTALPEELKMGVVLASCEGRVCAGAIYSAIGDTAVYLFGATDEVGRRTAASYLVQWQVIQLLQARGFKCYDLNGVNQELNPGTYRFKSGLAGRNATEVSFVGQFQALETSITNDALLLVDKLRSRLRAARMRLRPAPKGD